MKDEKKPKKLSDTNKVIEEYYDLSFMKMKPINAAYVEKIAQEYIKYFQKNKTKIYKKAFLVHKGYHDQTFANWVKNYPCMKAADDYVKMLLAERNIQGCAVKKLNENMSRLLASGYDSDFREMEVDKATIQAKIEQKATTINIVRDYDEEDNTGSKR